MRNFRETTYLFSIAWLGILVDDFECSQSKGLDEEVLVDNVPSLSCTLGATEFDTVSSWSWAS